MTMQSKFWGAKVATFFQLCKLLPRNYWQFQIKAVPLHPRFLETLVRRDDEILSLNLVFVNKKRRR